MAQERLPWEPLLTAEEVQRALGYYGSGHSMRRVAAKLLAGQPIKVSRCRWVLLCQAAVVHNSGVPGGQF